MNYQHQRARRITSLGAHVIILAVALLSCASSFKIFRESFADYPELQDLLGVFALLALEGFFLWNLYGFRRSFSTGVERGLSLLGITFALAVMLCNLATHSMQTRGLNLADWQQDWVGYGAVVTLVAILVVTLLISLADPVARKVRLELEYHGRRHEALLDARKAALRSDEFVAAAAEMASAEAAELVAQIGSGSEPRQIGFVTSETEDEPERRAGFMASAVSVEKPPSVTRHKAPVRRGKKPPAPDGYHWRAKGAGFELRRDVYENGVRRQPYIAHLSAGELAEMRRNYRSRGAFEMAITEWVRSHDK